MRHHALIAVLEGRHPTPPAADLQMLVQGDLTAVLAAAPRQTPRAPQSLHQHLGDAATHLARQKACMRLAPLLPVRLDTHLTLAGTAAFLTANRPFLTQMLTRHAGLAQMQVTVLWQRDAAAARFPGEALHQIARRLSAAITIEIARVATAVAPLTPAPELLYSGMVLLPLQDLGALNRAAARITALWPEGLCLHQTGPDPVSAFATLDLAPITPRHIDRALATFGLPDLSALGQLPAIRRRKLLMAGGFDDGALRSEIHNQAEVLTSAARLDDVRDGFALCRIWSDSRIRPKARNLAVA